MNDDAVRLEIIFEQMLDNCKNKRRQILKLALRKLHIRRYMQIGSGVLAALSGASSLAIITRYTNTDFAQIIAAIFAFSSTIFTIVLGISFDSKDNFVMFACASNLQALRNKIEVEWHRPDRSSQQAFDTARMFSKEYSSISRECEQYLSIDWRSSDARLERSTLESKYIPPASSA